MLYYRQPQRHCKNAVIKHVLVTPFGFTKTCFVLVLQGTSQNFLPKLVFFSITNQNFDGNSHRRSETKIAKTSLTGTKPTYDEIQKKFGMYLVCSVSQICRYVGCLRVDLLFLRSARTAFFDMRICSHIGPKLACRRPGTKYCVDLFCFRTLWSSPP